jgi:hypothetical protein
MKMLRKTCKANTWIWVIWRWVWSDWIRILWRWFLIWGLPTSYQCLPFVWRLCNEQLTVAQMCAGFAMGTPIMQRIGHSRKGYKISFFEEWVARKCSQICTQITYTLHCFYFTQKVRVLACFNLYYSQKQISEFLFSFVFVFVFVSKPFPQLSNVHSFKINMSFTQNDCFSCTQRDRCLIWCLLILFFQPELRPFKQLLCLIRIIWLTWY